jgi:hypothetical protein
MQNVQKEYLHSLCKAASNEQDPEKLLDLIREINRLVNSNHSHVADAEKQECRQEA